MYYFQSVTVLPNHAKGTPRNIACIALDPATFHHVKRNHCTPGMSEKRGSYDCEFGNQLLREHLYFIYRLVGTYIALSTIAVEFPWTNLDRQHHQYLKSAT